MDIGPWFSGTCLPAGREQGSPTPPLWGDSLRLQAQDTDGQLNWYTIWQDLGPWFSGRTGVSKTLGGGSIPSGPANSGSTLTKLFICRTITLCRII
jgi:hypothetical protein